MVELWLKKLLELENHGFKMVVSESYSSWIRPEGWLSRGWRDGWWIGQDKYGWSVDERKAGLCYNMENELCPKICSIDFMCSSCRA